MKKRLFVSLLSIVISITMFLPAMSVPPVRIANAAPLAAPCCKASKWVKVGKNWKYQCVSWGTYQNSSGNTATGSATLKVCR